MIVSTLVGSLSSIAGGISMSELTVEISGEPVPFSVARRSSTLWIARGDYRVQMIGAGAMRLPK
jgi:hypothetical protein